MNQELLDVQAGFRKGSGTRDQIANICWVIEKAREFQKKRSTSASLTTLKPLTVWITADCGEFLKEMGIPDHCTCLLRNLYAGQEATVRTRHGQQTFWVCWEDLLSLQIWERSPSRLYIVNLLFNLNAEFSSVQSFSCDSLQPHGLQHARPPCPSPIPEAYPNSCPLSRWCHPTISSSVVPFSSCPQSFPASRSFPMSQIVASGSQSIGVSGSTSVISMNTQDWSLLRWTGWISLQSNGLSRIFSNTTVQSTNSLALSFLHSPTLTSIHDHWKNHSLD